MKYIITLIKLTLALLIICLSLLAWSVYTQSGRDFLTRLINLAPLSEGIVLKVKRIQSIFPLKLVVSRFCLQEDKTTWLDIEGVEISADILQYLNNKNVFAEITAKKFLLKNRPESRGSEGASNNMLSADIMDITADFRLNIHTFILEDYLEDESIHLQNFDIGAHYAQELRLELSGSVVNFGEPLLIKGNIFGNLDNLEAHFNLSSKHLEYQKYYIDHLDLTGDLSGLPSHTKGKITFSGNPLQLGNIAGEVNIEHRDDSILVAINDINSGFFNAKGSLNYNTIRGNGAVKLEGNLLNHSVPDMYSINAGEFHIDAKLLNDMFSGSTKINISDFKAYDSDVQQLSLVANIQNSSRAQDFLLNSTGKLKFEAQGLRTCGLTIDTFSLKGNLTKGIANLNMNASGPKIVSSLSGSVKQKANRHLIDIEKSNIEYNKVKMSLESPTQILWEEEQATIPTTKFNVGEGNLSLSGRVGAKSIDLQTVLNLPLKPFGALFLPPEHFIEGNLSSNIHIQGSMESPLIKGELILADGIYENIEYGAYINDIQARINSTGKLIDISTFSAKSHNEGELRLSGYSDLASRTVDISLTGSSFKILNSEQIEAFVKNISMNLTGEFDSLLCSGNLLFEKGKFDIGVHQAPEIKQIKECESAGVAAEKENTPTAKPLPIALNLSIKTQPQIKVYGKGLDSIWAGDLKLKGSFSDPLISGDIGLVRGSFKFLNTAMNLEEGNVIFNGSPENIPYYKVVTTTNNADYKLKVVIRGTPEETHFDFSSVPSLPKDEIISQILFGKLSRNLTALEAVQLARSVATLTGGGSTMDIMSELSDALGVNILSIDFDQQQSTASIHIEKRLNDRVKIITDQSSDIENSSVGVEVKVLDNLSVTTEHGVVTPDEKVSIKYKVDY